MSDRYQVHFTKANKTLLLSKNERILAAAVRQGVPIQFKCGAGSCYDCRVRMEGTLFDASQRQTVDAQNEYYLACQVEPRGNIKVEA